MGHDLVAEADLRETRARTGFGDREEKADVNYRQVLNVHEASEFLRVSESIVRRLIREQRIPYFQIEGRYLFYLPVLESWIEDRIVPPNGTVASQVAEGTANDIWQRSKRN